MKRRKKGGPKKPERTLFEWAEAFGTPEEPASSMEAEFWETHRRNPEVFALFDRFSHEAAARRKHYSADAVLHRIRWFTTVEMTGEPFKINDHYSAYYARLWMRMYPEHDGFFRTRRTRRGVSGLLAGKVDEEDDDDDDDE